MRVATSHREDRFSSRRDEPRRGTAWGHQRNHPDAYAGLAAQLEKEAGPENHPVYVLEDDGEVVGFFELRDRGEHIELLRMFLVLERIGMGYGRRHGQRRSKWPPEPTIGCHHV